MPTDSRPRGRNAFDRLASPLDAVNLRLLAELQGDPRLSMSELARRVSMSAPAVTERVARLEAAGVIAGYRMDIDPAALDMPITALVRIRPGPGQLSKVAEAAQQTAQVVECHRITGEDCFLLKVHAPSIGELERILDRFTLFGQTTTSIVVSTPVPPRPLPLPS
ncbi:Lrp/AsnC family transcriptional regulator [Rugosimonospora africana]|uniref:AsnC family transcriptional regulator n=1 Tax=Rugosimonospora africana TaxID=556532 RepID=A0A8J3QZI1_9ACTN|nr:AsnC family transcriptional regulator [Rugosimonospora africana]